MQFKELQLSQELIKAVNVMNFTDMTEIQEKSIPAILEGSDVIGRSNTGTGKTAAFGIPAVEMTDKDTDYVRTLILCPTRELALQASEEIKKFSKYMPWVKTSAVFGGASMEKQIFELKRGANIVVGTPGRVMDHIKRRTLKLQNLKMIILDEADEMLNMGFIDQVRDIINVLNKNRQTLLFSATIPEEVMGLCKAYMNNPSSIEIKSQKLITDNIKHELYRFEEFYKLDNLSKLLISEVPETAVVFCKTKENVDKVFENLNKKGYSVNKIHGGMLQKERLDVMDKFKKGNFKILVATDVAARGIDVEGITHVINYDLPVEKEAYVHRIGRTGRAGAKGKAISFVNQYEDRLLDMIQEYISFEIPVVGEFIEVNKEKREGAIKALKSKPKAKNEKAKVINKNITKLYFNGGKKKKLRAGDFVGAISKIEGITAEDIGIIDVQDTVSYVDILNGKGNKVIAGLKDSTIKGKKLRVEKAKR